MLFVLLAAGCSGAIPATTAAPSCHASAGRAAITRDGKWIVLATEDELRVFSPNGKLVKRADTLLHRVTDATFVGDTTVVALRGWNDGGFESSEILAIPDATMLASGGELVTQDDRTAVVVYFEATPNADVMHTWNARTRAPLPNGSPPQRWTGTDGDRPASAENERARAVVDAAMCNVRGG